MKETIRLDYPPDAHYNPAVRAGDFIYTCGHIGLEDESGKELTTIEEQTQGDARGLKEDARCCWRHDG